MKTHKIDINTTCRVCATTNNSNMVSLIDETSANGLSCYGEAVLTFADVSIRPNDKLPTNICDNCVSLLKQAITFKFICEESHEKLNKLIKDKKGTKKTKKLQHDLNMSTDDDLLDNMETIITTNTLEIKNEKGIKSRRTGSSSKHKDRDSAEYVADLNLEDTDSILDYLEKMVSTKPNDTTIEEAKPRVNKSVTIKIQRLSENLHDDTEFPDDFQNSDDEDNIKLTQLKTKLECKMEEKTFKEELETDNIIHCTDNNKILDLLENMVNGETNETESHKRYNRRSKTKSSRNSSLRSSQMAVKSRTKMKKQKVRKEPLECDVCQKVFSTRNTYKNHRMRHNTPQFICEHCRKAYTTNVCLSQHCGKAYITNVCLSQHCGKAYITKAELAMHMLHSHGLGKYSCEQCGYKAVRQCDLREHARVHTGERPYACAECGLTFRRQYIWKKHTLVHGERNLQCAQCPRTFYRLSHLQAHCNNVHRRMWMYGCALCAAVFARNKTVRMHLTQKHGVPRDQQGRIPMIKRGDQRAHFPE